MCVSCTQHTKLLMAPGASKNYSNANNYFKKMLDIQQLNYHCLWLLTFCTAPHHPPTLCTSSIPFPHWTVTFHLLLSAFSSSFLLSLPIPLFQIPLSSCSHLAFRTVYIMSPHPIQLSPLLSSLPSHSAQTHQPAQAGKSHKANKDLTLPQSENN